MTRAFALLPLVLAAVACGPPENPPVTAEPDWPSAEVEDLARRACFDCHSNETKWPIYSSLPFVSSLIEHDVNEGREALNFSTWDQPQEELDDLGEVVREGEMPLGIYLPLHPEASLSDEEKRVLAEGLDAIAATGVSAEDDD